MAAVVSAKKPSGVYESRDVEQDDEDDDDEEEEDEDEEDV